MSSARRLYRLNLAVGALGALVVIVALGGALSKVSLAPPPVEELLAACGRLLPADFSPVVAAILGLAGLGVVILARGVRSALVQARAQVRVRAGLRKATEVELAGTSIWLIQSSRPQAFCAGLLRPRVFLSAAAHDRLSETELRAVVAHEGHHASRRDPLRLLAARTLADALFFLPALRRLERRYAELAELAADEAALRSAGSSALASALLKLGSSDHPEATVALAPERVDHLCGTPPRWRLEAPTFLVSLLAVAAIAAVAVTAGVAGAGVRVEALTVIGQSCIFLMLAAPSAALGAALWRRARSDVGPGR